MNAFKGKKHGPPRTNRLGRRARKPTADELPPATAAAPVGDWPALAFEPRTARGDADIYAGPNAESAHRSLDGGEHPQRRDFRELDRELARVTPTLPLTLGDAAVLFDVVRKHAPGPLIRDVMHDHKEIVVRIFDGSKKIYERRLRAK